MLRKLMNSAASPRFVTTLLFQPGTPLESRAKTLKISTGELGKIKQGQEKAATRICYSVGHRCGLKTAWTLQEAIQNASQIGSIYSLAPGPIGKDYPMEHSCPHVLGLHMCEYKTCVHSCKYKIDFSRCFVHVQALYCSFTSIRISIPPSQKGTFCTMDEH